MPSEKIRLNALIDKEAFDAMQREVQKRYGSDSQVTLSSLTNEIIRAHYEILIENATV
tara:strand:+ start:799 stop:972 length:174 start_codon:yes stop_codon:yes gene_type:complete